MRQFLSLRYWFTLLALVGLALGVAAFTSRSGGAAGSASDIVLPDMGPTPRSADLVQWVFGIQAPAGITFVDGKLAADVALLIDGTRTMIVKAGTVGESTCPTWDQQGQCTVAADLLGEGVLWFSLIPGPPGDTIKLPAVVELLSDNMVRLANGWIVHRASVVDRSCGDETTSLANFVATYGDSATATFDFAKQRIVKVTCPRTDATTTTIVVDTTPPAPASTLPGGSTTTIEPG